MPFFIHWSWVLLAATGCAVVIIATAAWRRVAVRRSTAAWLAGGLACLAIAAGAPSWNFHDRADVTVMVDLSPSTRGASYRQREWLTKRLGQLLGDAPYKIIYFAGQATERISGDPLPDLPCKRTRFIAPAASAIVLFSDGQFDLPATAPPTFPVIDPGLEHAEDAAVVNVEERAANRLAIALRNRGAQRVLSLKGAAPATMPVGQGEFVLPATIDHGTREVEAVLSRGDLWPENDAVALAPAPPPQLQRWWVGPSPPKGNWRAYSPDDLPVTAGAYLAPSVIVLDDVSADALSPVQQDRLLQYVRDLGGGVVILGGDRAFWAGGYQGTALESISPLASNPPTPVHRWMILVDASGSMAQDVGTTTRWQRACSAVAQALPSLPPDDPVFLGSFAKDLHWWVQDQPARSLVQMTLPPNSTAPHGPTNLAAAIEQIAHASKGQAIPTELVLVTDGQAKIEDLARLAAALQASRIRLSVLAIGDDAPNKLLAQLVRQTHGASITPANPERWIGALRQLFRTASANSLRLNAISVTFTGPLAQLPSVTVSRWNRTWLKSGATVLATAAHAGAPIPLIAAWHFGTGQCAAAAYQPDAQTVAALLKMTAMPPSDPRFAISWIIASQIRVVIHAKENGTFINGLKFRLIASTNPRGAKAIPQTGPGEYALTIDRPRQPQIFTVSRNGVILARRAIAGIYPPEFDRIGINFANLAELARRTGGRVIEPADRRALVLPLRARRFALTSLLALLGGGMLAAGLVLARPA